jgi:hypothetical protein
MHVEFDSLPPHARVWIYQSDRKLNDRDKEIISEQLLSFTNQWLVHGQPLKASFDVRFDQFVILSVDEEYNATSGCSIDTSVKAIKQLEILLNVNFFDRSNVAFLQNDQVYTIRISMLGQKLQEGVWSNSTLTFNNVIPTKIELETQWLVPAKDTWLKRYLSAVTPV